MGKGGTVTLFVNDRQVAQGRVEKTIPSRFSADETFDIGLDTGSPVSEAYESPFKFGGTIDKVVVELGRSGLTAEDEKGLEKANQDVAAARE